LEARRLKNSGGQGGGGGFTVGAGNPHPGAGAVVARPIPFRRSRFGQRLGPPPGRAGPRGRRG
jgi:hypothetical protein